MVISGSQDSRVLFSSVLLPEMLLVLKLTTLNKPHSADSTSVVATEARQLLTCPRFVNIYISLPPASSSPFRPSLACSLRVHIILALMVFAPMRRLGNHFFLWN